MPTYAQVYHGVNGTYLCSYRTATKNTDLRILDKNGNNLKSWSLEGEMQNFVPGVTLVGTPSNPATPKVCDLFGAYDGETGHMMNRFWGFDEAGNIWFDWDTPNT